MTRSLLPLAILVFASHCSGACAGNGGAPLDLFVDPLSGNNNNAGSSNQPLKTLSKAIQTALVETSRDVHIHALEGDYDLSSTSLSLDFNKNCNRRFTISGPTSGGARLLGGSKFTHRALDSQLDAAVWSKISPGSRSSVRVADLGSAPLGGTTYFTSVEGENADLHGQAQHRFDQHFTHPHPSLYPSAPALIICVLCSIPSHPIPH
jgi:hypothetical protein